MSLYYDSQIAKIRLSLTGLNWGVNPDGSPRLCTKDNPACAEMLDYAYISLPSSLSQTDFFPPPGWFLTVVTDDRTVLTCKRQPGCMTKMQSAVDDAAIGRFFRRRLGLPPGQYITDADLKRYGRSYVTFYKDDDETFLMDFSPPEQQAKRTKVRYIRAVEFILEEDEP